MKNAYRDAVAACNALEAEADGFYQAVAEQQQQVIAVMGIPSAQVTAAAGSIAAGSITSERITLDTILSGGDAPFMRGSGQARKEAPKVLVPNPDDYRRELLSAEQRMQAGFLDSADAEHPAYAVTLPAGFRAPQWHSQWAEARKAYVLGDHDALERMAAFVTMDNPPLASDVRAAVKDQGHFKRGRTRVAYDREGRLSRVPSSPAPNAIAVTLAMVGALLFALVLAYPSWFGLILTGH